MSVRHTGDDGGTRLASRALFDGLAQGAQAYDLLDDFVGQGGALATLAGFIRGTRSRLKGALDSPTTAMLNDYNNSS